MAWLPKYINYFNVIIVNIVVWTTHSVAIRNKYPIT